MLLVRTLSDADLAVLIAARRARLRRRKGGGGKRLVLGAALAISLIVAGTVAGGAFTGRALLFGSCRLDALRPISLGENSFLYARDGSLLGVVPSRTNRQPLQLGRMSPWLPKATVAIEDRRFWRHGALDYQGIARAVYADVNAGRIVEGGSTITQELVRNLYIGNSDRTFGRKIKEACLAEKLAQTLTKKQILAAYLNEVFYGRHAFGAEAGAQTFFSAGARSLTLPQAALLAGLPQAPSVYDPVHHPNAAVRRRNDVLRALLLNGDISQLQFSEAVASPLGLKLGRLYSSMLHPNFFGWAQQQLVARYGARRVEAGGLQVKTTLDPRMQYAARTAVGSVMKDKRDPGIALVAIDPQTGAVKAMISYVPDGRKLQFNLATQGHRQAGSSFKPFVLATAIDQGASVYSGFSGPSSLTITDPLCATNGVPWDVHNYADESGGYMNLLDATAHSVNTIFAQLVDKVGPRNVVPVARRMGITSKLQPVCSIVLGTQAVTPLEMTTAYATLAARGIHHAPQAFELVRGPGGATLGKLQNAGDRALPTNVADLVTYALQGVVQRGTGTAAGFGRPAAGKTGTAESFQDAWFCGYVPQLAACVWIGYPKAEIPLYGVEGYSAVFGGSLPAEIWRRFMSAAVAQLPVRDFAYPVFTGHTIGAPPAYYSAPATTTDTTPTKTTPAPPVRQTTPSTPKAPTPQPTPAPTPTPAPAPPQPQQPLPPAEPSPSPPANGP
ncbi:MAG: penicillin-binding protein [Actinomycetia bacterium]|nr:penicillin-binding protein [Actinomycetes bacterium]